MPKKVKLLRETTVLNGAKVVLVTQAVTPAVLARQQVQNRKVATAYCDCVGGCSCDEDEPPDPVEAVSLPTSEEVGEFGGRFGANALVQMPNAPHVSD